MATPDKVVIIGGGLAGGKTADQLRERGFTGSVTLLAEESHPPYERPPLSKGYLGGDAKFEDSWVHPLDWYQENDVDLRLGTTATAVDTSAKTVTLSDGSSLDYDALVLATGSAPRRSTVPGADADGVHYLRTKEDSDALAAAADPGRKFAFIGGGWIGLEAAASLRSKGAEVTVLELDSLPLARIVGTEVAEPFAALHRKHGVDLRTNAEVVEILTKGGKVAGVKLGDGTTIEADAVVVGIGAIPRIELAEAAGLTIEAGGVAVDSALRTSDPSVFAVGDIATHRHPLLNRPIRVEHWATALNQPAAVAATLTGEDTDFTELPFFFSDQYDLGLEYYGSVPRGLTPEIVIRGNLEGREFVAFYLDTDGAVLAVIAVNVWDVIDAVKPVILEKRIVDRARLADDSVPLDEL